MVKTGPRKFGGSSAQRTSGAEIGQRNIHNWSHGERFGDRWEAIGDQPIFKKRHLEAPFGPVKPWIGKRVMQDKATVYTLTAGYYPTFTQDFNNLKNWYQGSQQGLAMVNESFNERGPAAVSMRGNHVWYKYASDYAASIDDIPDARLNTDTGDTLTPTPDQVADVVQPKYSLLDEIFEKYWSWVGSGVGTTLLNSWREILAGQIYKAGQEIITKEEGQELKDIQGGVGDDPAQQAPEELLPDILQKMGMGKGLWGDISELFDTYGEAKPIDIIMKFNGIIYSKDVTQSTLMERVGHTNLKTFKTDTATLAELGKPDDERNLGPLRKDLRKHFETNRKGVNAAMETIYNAYIKEGRYTGEHGGSGKYKTSLRDFASGKKLTSKAAIGDTLAKLGVQAAGDGVNTVAMGAALHILGQMFTQYAQATTGSGSFEKDHGGPDYSSEAAVFSDVFILSEQYPIAVGVNYRMSEKTKYWSLKIVREVDIQIMPDNEFYMDWFMQNIIGMEEEERIQATIVANIIWGNSRLYATDMEIVLGLAQNVGYAVTSGGYIVAGGAIAYEDRQANEAIGRFLQKVFDPKKAEHKLKNLKEVQQALSRAKNQGQSFHDEVAEIPTPISHEYMQAFPNNPMAAAFYDPLVGMNTYLKSVTWAAPYVGIYYQGGQVSGIQPLLMGKK